MADGILIRFARPMQDTLHAFGSVPVLFYVRIMASFSTPKEPTGAKTTYEKICNRCSADVCAINFDTCGRDADYWQV
jgi:hypothetical protein